MDIILKKNLIQFLQLLLGARVGRMDVGIFLFIYVNSIQIVYILLHLKSVCLNSEFFLKFFRNTYILSFSIFYS